MIPDLAGTAAAVEITIDEIRRIANTTIPATEEDATKATQSFRDLAVDTGAFGGHPLAKELAHQHRGAHEVFVETINGVIRDLQDFADKLRQSMDSHEQNDDAVAAMLVTVSKKYDGHRFHSDLANEQARTDRADDLTTSRGGAGTAPAAEPGHAAPPPATAGRPPQAPEPATDPATPPAGGSAF